MASNEEKKVDPMLVSTRAKRRAEQPNSGNTPFGTFKLQDFIIELFVDDTILTIEAENVCTQDFSIKKLTAEEISKITHKIFTSPIEMADIMLFASQRDPNSEMDMTINDEAKITITQTTSFGRSKKVVEFVIELEPENLDALEASKKFFKKLQEIKPEASEPFNQQLIKLLQKVLEHEEAVEKKVNETLNQVKALKPEEKVEGQ